MTATIVAAAEVANTPPRVKLTLSGFGSDPTVDVVRVSPGNVRTPVRTLTGTGLVGGGKIAYEYEARFKEPATYQATSSSGVVAVSNVVTPAVVTSWLIHPGVPSRSIRLKSYRREDRTHSTGRGLQYPIGASAAVSTSSGVRRGPTFNLIVQTYGLDEYDALIDLLADSSVLLLQLAEATTTSTTYMWVDVGDIGEADLVGTGFQDDPYRALTLPCTEAEPPDGMLQAQRTLGTIKAQWPTLGAIKSSYLTLGDISTDSMIGG